MVLQPALSLALHLPKVRRDFCGVDWVILRYDPRDMRRSFPATFGMLDGTKQKRMVLWLIVLVDIGRV